MTIVWLMVNLISMSAELEVALTFLSKIFKIICAMILIG